MLLTAVAVRAQYIMTLDLKSGQPKLVANLTVPNDRKLSAAWLCMRASHVATVQS